MKTGATKPASPHIHTLAHDCLQQWGVSFFSSTAVTQDSHEACPVSVLWKTHLRSSKASTSPAHTQ